MFLVDNLLNFGTIPFDLDVPGLSESVSYVLGVLPIDSVGSGPIALLVFDGIIGSDMSSSL